MVPNHSVSCPPRVARLTDEEYNTFKAMMQQEEEEYKSYGVSDDEEEEEDDPRNSYKWLNLHCGDAATCVQ